MQSLFEASIRKGGFEVLGWADVGFLNVYSNRAIRTPEDLREKSVKLWLWSSDPIVPQMAKILRKTGVSVGVPDVLPALNTNRINTILGSPYACHTLQWCSKMTHRTNMPVGVTIGAIVVSRKVLDKISEEHRAILREENAKASKKLIRKVRRLNKKTLKLLNTKIESVDLTPEEKKAWQDLFVKAQNALAGTVYSKAMLEKVRSL
jgi:TRAP-type C4-dicarboxylate transport system substrate-binding protein